MSKREYADDPNLAPEEKQFSIVGTKDRERVRIHSEIGSLTRRLDAHPDAEVEQKREEDGTVVAITVTLPRSCVSIKSKPRATENWSQVVSGGVLETDQ